MALSFRMSAIEDGEDVSELGDYGLLFFKRPGRAYVKVWGAQIPYRLSHNPSKYNWKHMSHHDSSWRTDGFRQLERGIFNAREKMEARGYHRQTHIYESMSVMDVQIVDLNMPYGHDPKPLFKKA